MKVIYLLPTREKEVAVYKVTANNTKKKHLLLLFLTKHWVPAIMYYFTKSF